MPLCLESKPKIDIALITALRIPYYSTDVPFMVSWSHKAGCTSVLKWFLYQAELHDEAVAYVSDDVGLNIHSYERDIFRKAPGYRAGVASRIKSGMPVINFVRCPYQRAFSSYMHLNNRSFINQVRNGIKSPGLRVRQNVLHFVYGTEVSVEYPLSFLDYLQWLKQCDRSTTDPHHTPQHSEIYKYSNIRHYRLEDFAAATQSIEREFNLRPSATHRNLFSSGHHKKKVNVPGQSALRLLERSMPLHATELFNIPRVNGELLKGTRFEQIINLVFEEDIALHDSLTPL